MESFDEDIQLQDEHKGMVYSDLLEYEKSLFDKNLRKQYHAWFSSSKTLIISMKPKNHTLDLQYAIDGFKYTGLWKLVENRTISCNLSSLKGSVDRFKEIKVLCHSSKINRSNLKKI